MTTILNQKNDSADNNLPLKVTVRPLQEVVRHAEKVRTHFLVDVVPNSTNTVVDRSVNVLFILDGSSSMNECVTRGNGPSKFSALCTGVITFVADLAPVDRVGFVLFDDKIIESKEPILMTEENKARFVAEIEDLGTRGNTRFDGPLHAAMKMHFPPDMANVVVFVTDGATNDIEEDLPVMQEFSVWCRDKEITLITLGTGHGYRREPLIEMAVLAGTQSQHLHAENTETLSSYLVSELAAMKGLAVRKLVSRLVVCGYPESDGIHPAVALMDACRFIPVQQRVECTAVGFVDQTGSLGRTRGQQFLLAFDLTNAKPGVVKVADLFFNGVVGSEKRAFEAMVTLTTELVDGFEEVSDVNPDVLKRILMTYGHNLHEQKRYDVASSIYSVIGGQSMVARITETSTMVSLVDRENAHRSSMTMTGGGTLMPGDDASAPSVLVRASVLNPHADPNKLLEEVLAYRMPTYRQSISTCPVCVKAYPSGAVICSEDGSLLFKEVLEPDMDSVGVNAPVLRLVPMHIWNHDATPEECKKFAIEILRGAFDAQHNALRIGMVQDPKTDAVPDIDLTAIATINKDGVNQYLISASQGWLTYDPNMNVFGMRCNRDRVPMFVREGGSDRWKRVIQNEVMKLSNRSVISFRDPTSSRAPQDPNKLPQPKIYLSYRVLFLK